MAVPHRFYRESIPADGSDRAFYRTTWEGREALIICPSPGENGRREASSYVFIGQHLRACGVPVPEIYHVDEANGEVVVEYVGSRLMHAEVLARTRRGDWPGLLSIYRKAVAELARMQARGGRGFKPEWCFDTAVYDAELAFTREASYFLRAFAGGYAGVFAPPEVEAELAALCARVDALPRRAFFLHRDFQSRNILLQEDKLRIVDFQGGRLGPLGYDLAALLLDPYAGLPMEHWATLFDPYLHTLEEEGVCLDREAFEREFRLLALLRSLQILGAYGHLSKAKGKTFFEAFIPSALKNLRTLLDAWDDNGLVCLTSLLTRLLPAAFGAVHAH